MAVKIPDGMKLENISTRTLQKWYRQLLDMNEKSSGKFWSHINYSLNLLDVELLSRGKGVRDK